MTHSGDQFHNRAHENYRESRGVLSSEPSSDVSQIGSDRLVNENHGNFSVSHTVPSSEPYSDTGVSQSDDQLIEQIMLFPELAMAENELQDHFHNTGVVSQSDDVLFDQTNPSTSENQVCPQPPRVSTAVFERIPLTIIPNNCSIKGGCSFTIFATEASQVLHTGIYSVRFGDYGICKVSGFDKDYLRGKGNIPPAARRGTHPVEVQVSEETGKIIDNIEFEYVDDVTNECVDTLLVQKNSRSSGGSDPHNESRRPTKKSSSDPEGFTGSCKKPKNCPIDIPMLMYLCDEMAKRGDEHFFSALTKLGTISAVLEYRSEYFKDFAETARENGHNKLAETIETSSRELPCDHHMETLTFGKLHDAVQKERSLSKSDFVNSSDSDDNSNSCSSGYNGDCDSEDEH